MQILDEPLGSTTYTFGLEGRVRFSIAKLDPVIAAAHQPVLTTATNTLAMFDEALLAVEKISANRLWSSEGKETELVNPRAKGCISLASGWAQVLEYDRMIDGLEASLLHVPEATSALAVQEDTELRSWFLNLATKAKAEKLQQMTKGPELRRLELAILRGPGQLMIADQDAAHIRRLWNEQARLNDLGKAMQVSGGRVAVEWARRCIAHACGLAMRALGWDRQRQLRALIESQNRLALEGAQAFGFGEADVLQMQAMVRAKQFEAPKPPGPSSSAPAGPINP